MNFTFVQHSLYNNQFFSAHTEVVRGSSCFFVNAITQEYIWQRIESNLSRHVAWVLRNFNMFV